MKHCLIKTNLGKLIAIGDNSHLYLLQFVDRRGIKDEIESIEIDYQLSVEEGTTASIEQVEEELRSYFCGALKEFKTPVFFKGSPFQKKAWGELIKVPYGETRSYKEQATSVGNSKAFRAVANANSINPLGIIIPCHRIINTGGKLGGYGGGIERKHWLLNHEKTHSSLF